MSDIEGNVYESMWTKIAWFYLYISENVMQEPT